MDQHDLIMKTLTKVASDICEPVRSSRIAACVVYRNSIVAFGINEKKSHPFQAKYGKNSESIYLHAEISAIKNALRYITPLELEKSTLYIYRIKFQDSTKRKIISGLSKPCAGCFRCISAFRIKNVYYSIEGDTYAKL
jgi:deoxycytidylate deaminase